jgi:methanogenic corrinoid protein MtbC1
MQPRSSTSDAPLYNTAAVVQRTGVPATTIRAWERRYGYPKPSRDSGGQRLYSEREIDGIRWLADQTARGVAISRAVNILRAGHAAASASAAAASEPDTRSPRSFAALRADLLGALLAFDLRQADAVMTEAFALFAVEDVCLQVLEPLMVEVGDRWHAGEISVAEEHHVTSFVRAKLFGLLSAYQRTDGAGPLILTACAPEEWHEIGILVVSVFLARRGFTVTCLGPNLPLDGLARLVARHHPAVVVLSAQSREAAARLGEASSVLGSVRPPQPLLAFGGQAFNVDASLRATVAGTYVGPSADAAARAVAELLTGPPRRSDESRTG